MRHRVCLSVSLLLLFPAWLHAYDNLQLKQTLLPPSTTQSFVPAGVVVDRTGRVWVTDSQNNVIVVYSSAGVFMEQVGHSGAGPGEFSQPHGIATDPEGLI